MSTDNFQWTDELVKDFCNYFRNLKPDEVIKADQIEKFKQSKQSAPVDTGKKYSFEKRDGKGGDGFIIFHNESREHIAKAPNAEKAHFITTAINQYQEPGPSALPTKGNTVTDNSDVALSCQEIYNQAIDHAIKIVEESMDKPEEWDSTTQIINSLTNLKQ